MYLPSTQPHFLAVKEEQYVREQSPSVSDFSLCSLDFLSGPKLSFLSQFLSQFFSLPKQFMEIIR